MKPRSIPEMHTFFDPYLEKDIDGPINRSAERYDKAFISEDGKPLTEAATRVFNRNGSLVIMDVGCGNGRALYEIKKTVAASSNDREQRIIAIGIDRNDYSLITEDYEIKDALTKGGFTYLQGDVQDIEIPRKDIDLIVSHQALRYNSVSEIVAILDKLTSHLAPQGQIYFDLADGVRMEDPLLAEAFENFTKRGYKVSTYGIEDPVRLVARITAPAKIKQ